MFVCARACVDMCICARALLDHDLLARPCDVCLLVFVFCHVALSIRVSMKCFVHTMLV